MVGLEFSICHVPLYVSFPMLGFKNSQAGSLTFYAHSYLRRETQGAEAVYFFFFFLKRSLTNERMETKLNSPKEKFYSSILWTYYCFVQVDHLYVKIITKLGIYPVV